MSPRKLVEKELDKSIILDAARALFADHGYQAISIRMIAKKLGYSSGSLYYHFKDKAEI